LFDLKVIRQNLGINFEDAKREDIERFSAWLNSQKYTPRSLGDYVNAITRFYKFLPYGTIEKQIPYPEEVRWLKSTAKPNETRLPDFLTPAEVELTIKACDRPRDRAMLPVGFEAGLRATELLLLNVGSIRFDEKGAMATVMFGKTGARHVRLITSAPLPGSHLEFHSRSRDPSSPLWMSEATNYRFERLSWFSWSRTLEKIALDSGVSKRRIYNHLLKHGNATEASKVVSEFQMKVRYGGLLLARCLRFMFTYQGATWTKI
jgi:site-specific recombinase XerD